MPIVLPLFLQGLYQNAQESPGSVIRLLKQRAGSKAEGICF